MHWMKTLKGVFLHYSSKLRNKVGADMTEHYFSQNPHSKSAKKSWRYNLRDRDFIFTSDVGVFSKKEVDYGSRLLIEKFNEPEVDGDILDLGCGYGPIGIAIASDYQNREVFMVDINERAVSLAKQNAELNHLKNVRVFQSDRFSSLENFNFAAIVTNPPIRAGKKVVHQMFEGAKAHLLENGELWVVIQKKQGAPSAKDKLEELFGEVDITAKDKGYYLLRCKNIWPHIANVVRLVNANNGVIVLMYMNAGMNVYFIY